MSKDKEDQNNKVSFVRHSLTYGLKLKIVIPIILGMLLLTIIINFSVHLYKNRYGHFEKVISQDQPSGCFNLIKLKSGNILILGRNNYHSDLEKNSSNIPSSIFDIKSNKIIYIQLESNLYFSEEAILLKNGKILLTNVYPNRMAILTPETLSVEKYINLSSPKVQYYVCEIGNNKIAVFGGYFGNFDKKTYEKHKEENNFVEIYDIKTGLLINKLKIGKVYPYDRQSIFVLEDNKIFIPYCTPNIIIDLNNYLIEKINNPYLSKNNSSNSFCVKINDAEVLIFSQYDFSSALKKTIVTKFNIKNKTYEKIGLYDFNMSANRLKDDMTFTLLSDKNILICGGYKFLDYFSIFRYITNNAYIFDTYSNKFIRINNMNKPRTRSKSILLDDGRVLIVNAKNLQYKAEIYTNKINREREFK